MAAEELALQLEEARTDILQLSKEKEYYARVLNQNTNELRAKNGKLREKVMTVKIFWINSRSSQLDTSQRRCHELESLVSQLSTVRFHFQPESLP